MLILRPALTAKSEAKRDPTRARFCTWTERLVRSARRMENAPGIRESGAAGPRVFANIMRTGGGIPE